MMLISLDSENVVQVQIRDVQLLKSFERLVRKRIPDVQIVRSLLRDQPWP